MDITSVEFNPFTPIMAPWPVLTLWLRSSGSPTTRVRHKLLTKLRGHNKSAFVRFPQPCSFQFRWQFSELKPWHKPDLGKISHLSDAFPKRTVPNSSSALVPSFHRKRAVIPCSSKSWALKGFGYKNFDFHPDLSKPKILFGSVTSNWYIPNRLVTA